MSTRTPSRIEALAVLRGEREWHIGAAAQRHREKHPGPAGIHEAQAEALRRAIDVLEGNAQPRGTYCPGPEVAR